MQWKTPAWARVPRDENGRVLWPALARRSALWLTLAAGALLLAGIAFVLSVIPTAPGVNELRALQEAKPSVIKEAAATVSSSASIVAYE